jgi:hypothetical protein
MLLAVLIMGAMGLVGYVAAKAVGLDGKYLRAFLMVVMFSNGGNYGLPVVKFAFGPEALTYATIFFLTGSVMTYLAGAFFAGSQRGKIAGALEKVWKMPSLYGLALALVVRAGGRPVPEAIMRPVDLLSDAALPVMILVLGMQLERAVWPARPGIVILAVGISLLVAPLVALGLTGLLGVTGAARQSAVILSSMPVAVITTILALEFELAPEFVTSAVFLSTIASPLTADAPDRLPALTASTVIRDTRNSSRLPGHPGRCNTRTWDKRTTAGCGRGTLSPSRRRTLEPCPSPPS